ncbi:MAG TPA: O-antigen ligase family protein [Candidatus Acidoferrum sp.]|nr:O-antigen ligase family protein [Candidatus Acidoferrum sp.]
MTFFLYVIVAITVAFIDGWAPTRSGEDVVFRLGIGRIYLMEWLIYGLLAAYVLDWVIGESTKNRSTLFERTALDKPLQRFGLLLPAFAVYGLLHGNPLQEAVGYFEWRSLFLAIVFYSLLASILNTPEKAKRLFHWFLGLCALKGGYYLFFYLSGIPYPLEQVIGAGPVDEGAENAMFIFAGLPAISLWLFRGHKRTPLQEFAPWAALLLAANLMISAKRTIQGGLIVGLAFLFLRMPWRRVLRHAAVAAAVISVLVLVLSAASGKADTGVSASVSRFDEIGNFIETGDLFAGGGEGETLAFHLLDYVDAWNEITQRPILGSGFGSQYERWYTTLPAVGGQLSGYNTGMVHSQYLYFWWKMGLPGLLAFGALVLGYFRFVKSRSFALPLTETQAVALGLYAAVWAELSMDFWGAQWIGNTKNPLVIFLGMALTVCLLREKASLPNTHERLPQLGKT